MENPDTPNSLSPTVRDVLARLRGRIRTYVWCEGIAIAVCWICLTFWVALAIDYLPVFFGMSELPWQARAVLLILISGTLAWILYRWIFRRAFVRLQDRSMALLLERRFAELDDSLITSVEANSSEILKAKVSSERAHLAKMKDKGADENAIESQSEMLARTRRLAEGKLDNIQLSQVFNFKPLWTSASLATLLFVSIAGFALLNTESFALGSSRLYLLDTKPWPRKSRIELVGAKIRRENPVEGIEDIGSTTKFENDVLNVAKGTSLTLLVRAAADVDENPDRKVPQTCSVIARSADGQRGTYAMKKIGSPRDGFQMYSLDTQPFKTIMSDLKFELLGGDHRIGTFSVNVVDSPAVVQTTLKCRFPEYMVDEQSGSWTEREIPWTAGMELPIGTRLLIQCRSNKPLSSVFVKDLNAESSEILEIESATEAFEIPVESIEDALDFEFVLKDRDGVIAEDPHRITIAAVEDQPPVIDTRLQGIGSAVTPDVRIPLGGEAQDDYGISKSWVEIVVPEGEPLVQPIQIAGRGKIDAAVDFRERRQTDGFNLPTDPETKISVVIKSQDRFDLGSEPNVGVGDLYELEVVKPEQLLMILDRSEVNQRKRLEQIYNELSDARGYLVKTGGKKNSLDGGFEPGDRAREPGDKADDDGQSARRREIRLLFSQRANLQIQKSIQEISGVSDAFEDIRLQLINNRVDSEDRKLRLENLIVAPLRRIAGMVEPEENRASLKQLEQEILEIEAVLEQLQAANDQNLNQQAELLTSQSIEKIDDVLLQLNSLIGILKKFENQSELIEIVQRMLDRQKELMDRTRKERERSAFEGLLDK